jgi:hypothetical protein
MRPTDAKGSDPNRQASGRRPRLRDYIVRRRHPSFRFHEEFASAMLPEEDIMYHDVPRAPAEYHGITQGRAAGTRSEMTGR